MVRPVMKYLWKKGYAQATGNTMRIATAIRADSLGIVATSSAKLIPMLIEFRASASALDIKLLSNACSE